MAQYTVTASTSVVLINSLDTPYTTVLLSSIMNPGHIVGIRDGTGSALIRTQPIVVSTTKGVYFFDKTFSTLITEPFGSVSVSSKDPSTWQLLNTAGFFTSLSNAYLTSISSQYAYVNQVSSAIDVVSTSVIGNIAITNTIFLNGNTKISGDIVVTGDVDLLQTLGVNRQLSISSGLTVGDAFTALSSLRVVGNLVVGGFMSTQNSLFVQDSLYVDQNIDANAALVPKYLSVQTLYLDKLNVGGGIQSAYDITTQSNAYIGQDILSLGSTTIGSTLSVKGQTAVYGGFYSDSNLTTNSLSTLGSVAISKDVSVEGTVVVQGTASTLGNSIFIARQTGVKEYSVFDDAVNVTGISQFKVLAVGGSATISSIQVNSAALIQGDALSYGSTFIVGKEFEILGNLAVGGSILGSNSYVSISTGVSTLSDLGVGANLVVGDELSVRGGLFVQNGVSGVSTLLVKGNLSTNVLTMRGDVTVLSNIFVPAILGTSTLGAPIDLSISTLTLSNTLYVTSWGKVPLLDINEYPSKIIAGDATITYADINVGGILNNRSTVDQTSYTGDSKLWYATQVRASTIVANSLVSSLVIGPVGTTIAPGTDYLFTVAMTSILNSTLSSVVLYASTVNVSSLQSDSLFGDGAGLSNINSFRSSVYASSFFGVNGYSLDISAQTIRTQYMTVKDKLTVVPNPFLSSIELWIAAGYDSEINGNIQTSYTGLNWSRTIGPSFDYYAKAVAGNSNISSPLYVAVGADSRTQYTIQWSENSRNWLPITSGGFEGLTSGIRKGNSVVYNSNLGLWVAAGNNEGTKSTLMYSTDIQNWYCANNAFSNVTDFVAASPTGFVALGTSVKYSGDGINWSDTATTSISLDTVAFGLAKNGPTTSYVWVGTSNRSIYISSDDGYTWQAPGYTTLANIVSLVYSGSNWLGVGSNIIQYSADTELWSNVTTTFAEDVIFNAVAYNSNQGRWVAGAVSTTADKSLWSSSNLQTWNSALSGGFSTSISGYGVGYSVFTSSTYTFAAGKAAFSGITPVEQAILQVFSNGTGNYVASNSLTMNNASNVFQSEVRGIYGSIDGPYHYVAVGGGEVPQKTIGRSLTGAPGSWVPAITGGFSTVGYGITHFGTNWIAVGDAQTTLNTIQYSPDGANWFGTNTAAAMNQGGRGITLGAGALANTLIAVGKDSAKSTILKSTDGYTWSPAIGSYFTVQGNAVAGGSNTTGPNFIAVGEDTRGYASTILQSQDGLTWSNVATGGFTGAGYGVAHGRTTTSVYAYVAVGYDANSNKTIQYSLDGGNNFAPVTSGAFTKAGYGVGFNTLSNLFFAVGEDVIATRNATIKYSGDGANWSNISTGSGFLSQTTLGAAFGLYTQQVLNTQLSPYIEFSNLIFYESAFPILYPRPTVRIQSSFMVLNETMYMNLSSQMIINSNVPYNESTVMTVYGNIYTSSLVYTGPFIPTDTLYVSSLNVSTLSSFNVLESRSFTTPSLAFNTGVSKANSISTFATSYMDIQYGRYSSTNMLNINGALYTTANIPTKQKTGIYLSSPQYDLDIHGTFGTSSFSTAHFFAPAYVQTTATGEYIHDSYLTFYSGNEGTSVPASNLFTTTVSSFTVNNILHVNLSSQNVGIYTREPQFTLDVRSQTYVQSLSTPLLNTSLLFLTLQSA